MVVQPVSAAKGERKLRRSVSRKHLRNARCSLIPSVPGSMPVPFPNPSVSAYPASGNDTRCADRVVVGGGTGAAGSKKQKRKGEGSGKRRRKGEKGPQGPKGRAKSVEMLKSSVTRRPWCASLAPGPHRRLQAGFWGGEGSSLSSSHRCDTPAAEAEGRGRGRGGGVQRPRKGKGAVVRGPRVARS